MQFMQDAGRRRCRTGTKPHRIRRPMAGYRMRQSGISEVKFRLRKTLKFLLSSKSRTVG